MAGRSTESLDRMSTMQHRSPDFEAAVSFIPGSRRSLPFQGFRGDIRYDDDEGNLVWMVWPRFLGTDGAELPDGAAVPANCTANFYIANEATRNDHRARLRVGLHFNVVEGLRPVASCTVTKLLAIANNAV